MSSNAIEEPRTRPGLAISALGPYRVLLGNRDLAILLGGQIVSTFGDWLYITALVVLAYTLTHSATLVAALTFVRLLPYALFLPLGGALADRFHPKALMITADLGRFLCMLGLLVVTSRATIWLAFPLVFVATCLFSLFRPALNATLPGVVGDEEQLVSANTINSQVNGLAFVIGPSLAGVLILLGQTRSAFFINALTYLISSATLFLVHMPQRPAVAPAAQQGWLAETLAGYRFLFRENEGVLAAATLTTVGLTLFGGAFWTLVVVLSIQAYHIGSQGAGFLNTAYGAGALLGGVVLGFVANRVRVAPGLLITAALSGVAIIFLGLSPSGIIAFVVLVGMGIADAVSEVLATTLIQTATPQELLGRAFGAFESTFVFSMLLGTLAVGPLIGLFGARAVTCGMGVLALAILLLARPRLQRLESALGVRIFLRGVPVLSSLSRMVVDDLASRVQLEHVASGTTIVRQGDVGDKLYIVKQGEVEVIASTDGGEEVALATLTRLDYFGEIALLRDVPRTASVRARGPVDVYSLSRADFQSLLARSDELRATLAGTSEARYLETQTKTLLRL